MQRRRRRPTQRQHQREPPCGLYWVTTDDHHEDWFIVVRTSKAARHFHEVEEGYNDGGAKAEFVVSVPDTLQPCTKGAQYPTRELLERCGAEILRWDTPHAVRIRGRVFVEGGLQHEILTLTDDLAERLGKGRLNRTQRRGRPS